MIQALFRNKKKKMVSKEKSEISIKKKLIYMEQVEK